MYWLCCFVWSNNYNLFIQLSWAYYRLRVSVVPMVLNSKDFSNFKIQQMFFSALIVFLFLLCVRFYVAKKNDAWSSKVVYLKKNKDLKSITCISFLLPSQLFKKLCTFKLNLILCLCSFSLGEEHFLTSVATGCQLH